MTDEQDEWTFYFLMDPATGDRLEGTPTFTTEDGGDEAAKYCAKHYGPEAYGDTVILGGGILPRFSQTEEAKRLPWSVDAWTLYGSPSDTDAVVIERSETALTSDGDPAAVVYWTIVHRSFIGDEAPAPDQYEAIYWEDEDKEGAPTYELMPSRVMLGTAAEITDAIIYRDFCVKHNLDPNLEPDANRAECNDQGGQVAMTQQFKQGDRVRLTETIPGGMAHGAVSEGMTGTIIEPAPLGAPEDYEDGEYLVRFELDQAFAPEWENGLCVLPECLELMPSSGLGEGMRHADFTALVLELNITLSNEGLDNRSLPHDHLLRLCLEAMSVRDIEKMLKANGLHGLFVERHLDPD